jgi:hypothetical protein
MDFKLRMKISKRQNVICILVIFVLGFISLFTIPTNCEAQDQTPVPTLQNSNADNREIWMEKIPGGFPSRMPNDLLPAMKVSLNLTDEQMKAIEDLARLYEEFTQIEAHARDPYGKNPLRDKCVDGAAQLRQTLGGEKFDDFCQWVGEEMTISIHVFGLVGKNPNSINVDDVSAKIFNEIKNNYKTIDEEKMSRFESKDRATQYFLNHDKNLKLRILYEVYKNQYPIWAEGETKDQRLKDDQTRSELNQKRREILKELTDSGSY